MITLKKEIKSALIVGGSNGVGLALAQSLLKEDYDEIIIADKVQPCLDNEKIKYVKVNLTGRDYSVFKDYTYVDTLIITAGFGRPSLFKTFTIKEIQNGFDVNTISVISIIRQFYDRLLSTEDFNCLVMGSIAGLVSSPMFSVYAATKAAICRFVESVNVELKMAGTSNRILNVCPGSLKGTRFNGGANDLDLLNEVCENILEHLKNKDELYIPDYENVYKGVIERYKEDPQKFGEESYDYKLKSGRLNDNPQVRVGYLSGTFDLFHIGHLNLLKRAKEYCDYLVVGVHKDGSHKSKEVFIPFEERIEILKSIKYVDEVIESLPEDADVYNIVKYNYLFVGSDYKGTDRFKRYEEYFKDKDVEIIYFPYTKGTSSTQLRNRIIVEKEDE